MDLEKFHGTVAAKRVTQCPGDGGGRGKKRQEGERSSHG